MQTFTNNRFVVVEDFKKFLGGIVMVPVTNLEAVNRENRSIRAKFGIFLSRANPVAQSMQSRVHPFRGCPSTGILPASDLTFKSHKKLHVIDVCHKPW